MINRSEIRPMVEAMRSKRDCFRKDGPYFFRLEFDDCTRLNIWGYPGMDIKNLYTPLHSHAWEFTSQVIHGRFTNECYRLALDPNGDHRAYDLLRSPGGVRFIEIRERAKLHPTVTHELSEGDVYTMYPEVVHITRMSAPVMTFLKKKAGAPLQQYVLTPLSEPLLHDRMRLAKIDDVEYITFWRKVDQMLELAGL